MSLCSMPSAYIDIGPLRDISKIFHGLPCQDFSILTNAKLNKYPSVQKYFLIQSIFSIVFYLMFHLITLYSKKKVNNKSSALFCTEVSLIGPTLISIFSESVILAKKLLVGCFLISTLFLLALTSAIGNVLRQIIHNTGITSTGTTSTSKLYGSLSIIISVWKNPIVSSLPPPNPLALHFNQKIRRKFMCNTLKPFILLV